ncbi:MAG: hypothetical protein IPK80_27605 [Nannocystis sp.]|nr:hypothetical protein [Nannocystis sp.]
MVGFLAVEGSASRVACVVAQAGAGAVELREGPGVVAAVEEVDGSGEVQLGGVDERRPVVGA